MREHGLGVGSCWSSPCRQTSASDSGTSRLLTRWRPDLTQEPTHRAHGESGRLAPRPHAKLPVALRTVDRLKPDTLGETRREIQMWTLSQGRPNGTWTCLTPCPHFLPTFPHGMAHMPPTSRPRRTPTPPRHGHHASRARSLLKPRANAFWHCPGLPAQSSNCNENPALPHKGDQHVRTFVRSPSHLSLFQHPPDSSLTPYAPTP